MTIRRPGRPPQGAANLAQPIGVASVAIDDGQIFLTGVADHEGDPLPIRREDARFGSAFHVGDLANIAGAQITQEQLVDAGTGGFPHEQDFFPRGRHAQQDRFQSGVDPDPLLAAVRLHHPDLVHASISLLGGVGNPPVGQEVGIGVVVGAVGEELDALSVRADGDHVRVDGARFLAGGGHDQRQLGAVRLEGERPDWVGNEGHLMLVGAVRLGIDDGVGRPLAMKAM